MLTLSSKPGEHYFFYPDSTVKTLLSDYELGGVAIGDITQGFTVKEWVFVYDNDEIKVDNISLLYIQNVKELAGTFNRAMMPVVAYIIGDKLYLRHYISGSYTTIEISNAKSPRLTLDNKNYYYCPIEGNVLLFYLRGSNVFYRSDEDEFASENMLYKLKSKPIEIGSVGMNKNNRVQISFIYNTTPGLGCESGEFIINYPGDPSTWTPGTINQFTWANPILNPVWTTGQCQPDQWQRFPCGFLSGQTLPPWEPIGPIEPTLPCPEK